jgi:hypothetical protein
MTPVRVRAAALLLACTLLSAGCASAPHTGEGSPAKEHITPPVRLRGGSPPSMREEVRLHIEVLIGADGTPDMRTLKVSGKGAGMAHAAIESWIQDSMFTPGKRNGVPVAAVMKMDLESKIVRR